jgi:hypothetical protein
VDVINWYAAAAYTAMDGLELAICEPEGYDCNFRSNSVED